MFILGLFYFCIGIRRDAQFYMELKNGRRTRKRQKINEYLRPRKRARDQKYSTTVLQSFSIFAQRDSNLKKKKFYELFLKNYVGK